MFVTSNLKQIGKGSFSTCYLLNKKEVLLKSSDPIKECMSFDWFGGSTVFPNVEHVDNDLYKMEYFPKVKSLKNTLKPKQYEIYKELRKLDVGYVRRDYDLKDNWHKQFDTVSNKRFRNALNEALDGCGNYGTDIQFEISPRNVAVKNGMLILLDCFFIKSKLSSVRNR